MPGEDQQLTPPHRDLTPRLIGRLPAALVFGGTIGVSAFLLFTSQPMIGRIVLPIFGGAPAVWATVLLFFQVLLLLGYVYAHLVATRLSPLAGAALHVTVLLLAFVATIGSPRDVTVLHDPTVPVVPGMLAMLAVLIGPAAFAMTATTPLVSVWYARVRRISDPAVDPRDPYWLYALSNGGSLISLLAYPLLIEPRLGLGSQRTGWGIGFGLLVALMMLSALRLRAANLAATLAPAKLVDRDKAPTDRVPVRDRLLWLVLAAVPAGLLSAVTNLVTTDLIAAPLLWVMPLAIYLASFVVAFSARGRRLVPIVIHLAPATLMLLWLPMGSAAGWPILPLLLLEYLGLGVIAVAIHGRLAERRPVDRHLTGFYLVMSAGGALGGAFVALAAPVLFDGVWEYPVLVAAALAVLAITAPPSPRLRPIRRLLSGAPVRLVPYLLVVLPLLGSMVVADAPGVQTAMRSAALGGLLLLLGGSPGFLAVTTSMILVVAVFLVPSPVLFRDRSFFGVVEIQRDEVKTVLQHGTTLHGSQWRAPERAQTPLDYYVPGGPFSDLFEVWAARPAGQIRVVGLGAGALAAYARPGDELVFYEIDPLVGQVAADRAWFSFLADARALTSVRIGDGRLLVAEEPDDAVDFVIMDAFSSDTVPAHLVTIEALADIDRMLREDGILAVHVSNRYYDLASPVAAALSAQGLTVLERSFGPTAAQVAAGAAPTRMLAGTRSQSVIAVLEGLGWVPAVTDAVPLTDDFPDLLRYLGVAGS